MHMTSQVEFTRHLDVWGSTCAVRGAKGWLAGLIFRRWRRGSFDLGPVGWGWETGSKPAGSYVDARVTCTTNPDFIQNSNHVAGNT